MFVRDKCLKFNNYYEVYKSHKKLMILTIYRILKRIFIFLLKNKNKLLLIRKIHKIKKMWIKIIILIKKELKRKEDQDYLKISKDLLKDLKQIHKDGYLNGKEKDIRRKEKKEQVKLKV